jgi:hypothetical protein
MQQTLLVLAALVAFSIFAFGRHRADRDVERRALSAEVESAATDLALAVLEEAHALAWDEGDVGETGLRLAAPTSGIGRDAGEGPPDTFDDVDDYDGLSQTRLVALRGGDLPFHVAVAVDYVDPADPLAVVAGPTLAKRVRVSVESLLGAAGPPSAVVLQRVASAAGHAPSHL